MPGTDGRLLDFRRGVFVHLQVMDGGAGKCRTAGLPQKQGGTGVDVDKNDFRCGDCGVRFGNDAFKSSVNDG